MDRRGGNNFLRGDKLERVKRLVRAGASTRQIVRLGKVGSATAQRYAVMFRETTEGNWRRRISDAELEALL